MVVRYCVYARKDGVQEKGSLVEDFLSREEAETFAGIESCQMECEGYELYVLERNMPERKTETRAQELVKALKQSGDMISFVIESCNSAAAFGMYGEYNRSLFTRELQRQLEILNKENRVTARNGAPPGVRFISQEYDEEIKCPGCNWGTIILFMLETQGDNFEQDGLCGQCCMETIVAEQIKIPCDELNVPAEIVEGQLAEMRSVKTEEAKA